MKRIFNIQQNPIIQKYFETLFTAELTHEIHSKMSLTKTFLRRENDFAM